MPALRAHLGAACGTSAPKASCAPYYWRTTCSRWAVIFLVIALIAALLGFTTIAGASIAIAKTLSCIFLVVFLVLLVMGVMAGSASGRA